MKNSVEQKTRLLALITARGGSKGLPRKNILPVGGKPLIAWTISAAKDADCVDHVVLSSDDDEIMEVASRWGCEVPFRRPPELASDTATSIDVVLHAIDQVPGYDYVILLQPTSPLRTSQDIDSAFKLMRSSGAPSCVSVCEAEQSPYWMYRLKDNGRLENIIPKSPGVTRRQDLPLIYVLNGAIYIAKVEWLRSSKSFLSEETIAYLMPIDRSVDIDNAEDLEFFRRKIK